MLGLAAGAVYFGIIAAVALAWLGWVVVGARSRARREGQLDHGWERRRTPSEAPLDPEGLRRPPDWPQWL